MDTSAIYRGRNVPRPSQSIIPTCFSVCWVCSFLGFSALLPVCSSTDRHAPIRSISPHPPTHTHTHTHTPHLKKKKETQRDQLSLFAINPTYKYEDRKIKHHEQRRRRSELPNEAVGGHFGRGTERSYNQHAERRQATRAL